MPFSRRDVLVATLAGAVATSWPQRARASRLAVGKPAPSLALHALDGQTLSTDNLRGKVVILAFWATWCAPCREELPLLSRYAKAHADQGLQVLGFSLDAADNLAMVRQVAAGLSFPVGLLGSEWAGDYGRIWKLPVSFTIDRAGVLVDISWDDAQPGWTEARLQRVVTPLL
jgi:thiol-disulfide isomerase/thioredoxin